MRRSPLFHVIGFVSDTFVRVIGACTSLTVNERVAEPAAADCSSVTSVEQETSIKVVALSNSV